MVTHWMLQEYIEALSAFHMERYTSAFWISKENLFVLSLCMLSRHIKIGYLREFGTYTSI